MYLNKLQKVKIFLSKKNVFIPIIILIVIFLFVFVKNGDSTKITKVDSISGDLIQTVKATGQVTSVVDLNLSFKKQGIVNSLKYEVGDKVKKGQIIASLSSGSEYAELSRARASVLLAEAKLQKILEGATNEEITLAKVALETSKLDLANAKNTQDSLVNNAYNNLLNSSLEAVSENTNDSRTAPTISGTYDLGKEGSILLNIYNSGSGTLFSTSGLVSGGGVVSTTSSQKIGNSGLYILFSSTADATGSSWVINIPNKKASDYLTNQNAYNQALKTRDSALSSAQSLVNQRQAELAIKQASARSSDVALGQAEVLSAQASLQQARSNYEDTIIRAPKDGTITKVNIEYGELVAVNEPAIILQDISNLYVEALINESNITNIKLEQIVEILFDALGDSKKFTGVVSHIDPSSLTTDGIVNYKIKVSINETDPNIRPGMNSEISIMTLNKPNVFAISKAAIIDRDNKSYVNVITNLKNKKYKEVEVTTGVVGDGNMIEIISGVDSSYDIGIVTK